MSYKKDELNGNRLDTQSDAEHATLDTTHTSEQQKQSKGWKSFVLHNIATTAPNGNTSSS